MENEEELCERWCTRWWLKTEDSTNLWYEALPLKESDLFNRSEIGRGSLNRISGNAEP